MARSRSVTKVVRVTLVAAALALPTLSLIPFGGWLLWEKGWLLPWAVAAFVVVAGITAIEVRVFGRAVAARDAGQAEPHVEPSPGSQVWNERERQAWAGVLNLSRGVDVNTLVDVQAFMTLATRTIEVVAGRLHAEKTDPVWQFTMPEALAISERVSRRLSALVESHVPFGEQLTLAQLRTAYRWRGAIGVAEQAYDIWRILRLANPATAATHEARDRLSRALVSWGREQVTLKLAQSFVEEVGRAAIDLYGGRLRSAVPARLVEREQRIGEIIDAFPYRIAVAGPEPAARLALVEAINAAAPRLPSGRRIVAEPMFATAAGQLTPDARSEAVGDTSDVIAWTTADTSGRAAAAQLMAFVSATEQSLGPLPVVLPLVRLSRSERTSVAVAELDAVLGPARAAKAESGMTLLLPVAAPAATAFDDARLLPALEGALDGARARRIALIVGYREGAPPPGRVRQAASATWRAARSMLGGSGGSAP